LAPRTIFQYILSMVLPTEVDPGLHMLGCSCIDYIHGVSCAAAREIHIREAGVVGPVVPLHGYGIVRVKELILPRCLHLGAKRSCEARLGWVASGPWRRWRQKSSLNGRIELRPCVQRRPRRTAGDGFAKGRVGSLVSLCSGQSQSSDYQAP
jgi:hypothetical protein